jgi:hypothetical protein
MEKEEETNESLHFIGIIHSAGDRLANGYHLTNEELKKSVDAFKGKPLLIEHEYSGPEDSINQEKDVAGCIKDCWIDEKDGHLMGMFEADLSTEKGRKVRDMILNKEMLSLSFGADIAKYDTHDVKGFKFLEVSLVEKPAVKGSVIRTSHHVKNNIKYQRVYNSARFSNKTEEMEAPKLDIERPPMKLDAAAAATPPAATAPPPPAAEFKGTIETMDQMKEIEVFWPFRKALAFLG